MNYSFVTLTNLLFSPQATRDATSNCAPDLGYHYDPLDYLCTQVTIAGGAPTTLTNASVGLFGNYGFVMSGSSGMISQGQPNALNHVVWYPSVQEEPVLLNNISTVGSSVFNLNNAVLNYKDISLYFTELDMQGYRQNFMDTGASVNWPVVTLKDCQLRDVVFNVNSFTANGAASSSVTLQNDLWERCMVQLFNGYSSGYQNPLAVTLYNNTFWSNTIALSYIDSGASSHPAWAIHDNLFDGNSVSFSGNGSYSTYIGKSNNAHNNTTMPSALQDSGTDVSLTSLTYATSLLGNRYIGTSSSTLVNAGSRQAIVAGLADHTIRPDQARDTGLVDIGFHYHAKGFISWVWTNQNNCYIQDVAASSSPAIGVNGIVYFTDNCNLYAIDPNTHNLWTAWAGPFDLNNSGVEMDSSPIIGNNGTIYVGSGPNQNTLFAVNAASGTEKWAFTDSVNLTGGIYATPALGSDGTVYFGEDDDTVEINNNFVMRFFGVTDNGSSGALKANFPFILATSGDYDTDDSPAIGANGLIYFHRNL